KAIPFFDKRNTAFFNALSDEEDKKVLLQWLIGKYQALEDAEIQTVFDDPETVVFKTSYEKGEPLYSVLYLEKNLDFLKTDLPEKAELLDVMNRIRERAKKAQKS
ncbi:MAG: hypothetical protein IIY77_04710, partial [Lachnospiraceae bacterium]|nr:hypothetical protein [Lachnospiraceae bacterium]